MHLLELDRVCKHYDDADQVIRAVDDGFALEGGEGRVAVGDRAADEVSGAGQIGAVEEHASAVRLLEARGDPQQRAAA